VPANLSIRQFGAPLHDSASSPSFLPSCCWRKGLSYSCTPLRNESLSRSTLGAVPCGLDNRTNHTDHDVSETEAAFVFPINAPNKDGSSTSSRRIFQDSRGKDNTSSQPHFSPRLHFSDVSVSYSAWIVTYSSEELDVCRYEASWGL
jgi:hypothetical protein